MGEWLTEHGEALLTGLAMLAAMGGWLLKRERTEGRQHGEVVTQLKALSEKVDTLRVDARDDIEQIRLSVTQLSDDMRTERESRSRDVRDIYGKLDRQSDRIRSLTPPKQRKVNGAG